MPVEIEIFLIGDVLKTIGFLTVKTYLTVFLELLGLRVIMLQYGTIKHALLGYLSQTSWDVQYSMLQ